MGAQEPAILLDYLTRVQGIHVTIDPADPSKLRVSPWATLDGDTQLSIRRHKLELLAALRQPQAPVVEPAAVRLVTTSTGIHELVESRPDGIAILRRSRRMSAWNMRYVHELDGTPLAPLAPLLVADPRPDLAADHALWDRLLTAAAAKDGDDPSGLYADLHGLRCIGVQFGPIGDGTVDVDDSAVDEEDKSDIERLLLRHRWRLGELLRRMAT